MRTIAREGFFPDSARVDKTDRTIRRRVPPFLLMWLLCIGAVPMPWAAPVGYSADTMPEGNTPPFSPNAVGGSASVSSGVLTLTDDTAAHFRFYQRNDALISTVSAVMLFRLKIESSTAGLAVVAGFYD